MFGGDRIFLASLSGPGRIWLQSMPIVNLAEEILKHMPGGESRGPSGPGSLVESPFLLASLRAPAGNRRIGSASISHSRKLASARRLPSRSRTKKPARVGSYVDGLSTNATCQLSRKNRL